MSLQDTGPRILLAALIALLLFVAAFFVARGSSSEAALAPVREQPLAGSTAVKTARLRAIGTVPALPRARRKLKPDSRRSSAPPPARPQPSPRPPAPPPPPPPPIAPPPPPSGGCLGEIC
jgi:hypothetical protein